MDDLKKIFKQVVDYIYDYALSNDKGDFERVNTDKLDSDIIQIMLQYPEILTIQDENGLNLGMIAACCYLEKSVLKALDNKLAATQQDNEGYNIGMIAASHKLKEATLKAYQNKTARIQRNQLGDNIESIAKANNIELYLTDKFDKKEEVKNVIDDLHKDILGF